MFEITGRKDIRDYRKASWYAKERSFPFQELMVSPVFRSNGKEPIGFDENFLKEWQG